MGRGGCVVGEVRRGGSASGCWAGGIHTLSSRASVHLSHVSWLICAGPRKG